jgi:hypothetical protein
MRYNNNRNPDGLAARYQDPRLLPADEITRKN